MTDLQGFTAQDRVLVAAPHPDDESLATGGALQAAAAAGAARRVLIVTDGDNNPWPQRFIERRWHIGTPERARWGARRRSEALAALRVLGVASDDVHCYGLPDLGLTDALMCARPDVDGLLLRELESFRPTRLFLPALGDRHPDHSALHILLRVALARYPGVMPQLHAFGVHGVPGAGERLTCLALTPAQRDTKREAIVQHTSQMRLSRRRFVAFAKDEEPFRTVAAATMPMAGHPVHAAFAADGQLRIAIDHRRLHRSAHKLIVDVVLLGDAGQPVRFRLALGGRGAPIADSATAAPLGEAVIAREGAATVIHARLPLRSATGWVKLGPPTPGLFVFDRYGWQTVGAAGAVPPS